MRLVKIGRSRENDIVLRSPVSSSRHAELTIMNSGEILLEDKNSTNGTFLMGKRIQPSSPVSVRRGDRIQFADEELRWDMVPVPEDNSGYKAIYGIGSNFRNDIQIEGSTVSRFHATLKIDKSGNAFIIDHSTNGTIVNGSRIPVNSATKIRRGDSVVCGGVRVDLSRYIPSNATKITLFSALGAAVAIALVFLFGKVDIDGIFGGHSVSMEAKQAATVCVYGEYYIDIDFEDDPIAQFIPDWASGHFGPYSYTGTAFFVSNYGELATNRHVALPWEYLSAEDNEKIRQSITLYIKGALTNSEGNEIGPRSVLNTLVQMGSLTLVEAQAMYDRLLKSPFKIAGHHSVLGICYDGTMIRNTEDIDNAQVIAVSPDTKKDVALMRLNSKMTPSYIVDKGVFNVSKARTDFNGIKPQEEVLTIGYPGGLSAGLSSFNIIGKELRSTIRKSYVSKTPNVDNFEIQMAVVGGASGSPVMDSRGCLLGIAFGENSFTNIGYVCNIKHFCEIYEQNMVR